MLDAETTGAAGAVRTPTWLAGTVERIEAEPRLDRVAEAMASATAPMTAGRNGRILRGEWLGHALHPLLTDFPLGCWIGAGLLDLLGGRRSRAAAQRLVGLGLLAVPATAAAGAADWQAIRDPRPRRVGVVHAIGNTIVAVCYFRSWRARRAGHHLRGVGWGLVGGGLAWGTGYLGGHLSFGRGVGTGLRGMDLAAVQGDDSLLDRQEAADVLEVAPEQIDAMVDQGLLHTVDGTDGPRYDPSEVFAARLVGG